MLSPLRLKPSLVNRKAKLNHSPNRPPSLDFYLILCHTTYMTQTQLNMQYTRQQLIDALSHEYDYLCQEDPYDPEDPYDMTVSEYVEYLNDLSIEQLIESTDTDDGYTLDEYMLNHS